MKAFILIQDENAADFLRNQMQMLGNTDKAVAIRDPARVLRYLERHPTDAVFMDIDGETDWQSVCEMVKYTDQRIKLVLLSSNPLNAVKAFEAGASDFLPKPVEQSRLAKAIERFVQAV